MRHPKILMDEALRLNAIVGVKIASQKTGIPYNTLKTYALADRKRRGISLDARKGIKQQRYTTAQKAAAKDIAERWIKFGYLPTMRAIKAAARRLGMNPESLRFQMKKCIGTAALPHGSELQQPGTGSVGKSIQTAKPQGQR